MGQVVAGNGYELDAKERYVINIECELTEQLTIVTAIQNIGCQH